MKRAPLQAGIAQQRFNEFPQTPFAQTWGVTYSLSHVQNCISQRTGYETRIASHAVTLNQAGRSTNAMTDPKHRPPELRQVLRGSRHEHSTVRGYAVKCERRDDRSVVALF